MTNKFNIKLSELISEMYNSSNPFETFCLLNKTSYKSTFSKSEDNDFEKVIDILAKELENNKTRKALSITRALLLVSPDNTISKIRKKGIFRCSRYNYREKSIQVTILDMLQNVEIYKLTKTHIEYLQSVNNLLSFGPSLQRERASLVKRLRDNKNVVIKTLLTNVETIFTYGQNGDIFMSTDYPEAYTPEEIAEAFSYLLRLFQTCIGLKKNNFIMVDDSISKKPFYIKLLVDAAKMYAFHTAEIFIDFFPYKAKAIEDYTGVIKVESIEPLIEKTINIGYIQVILQKNVRLNLLAEELKKSPERSMMHFSKECFDRLGEDLIYLSEKPKTRYVIKIPPEHLLQPFTKKTLFLEDIFTLEMLGTEDYVHANTIIEIPVTEKITVIDILKVQRFFQFICQCFLEAFDHHPAGDDKYRIQINSCIPVFTKDIILQLLGQLISHDKAEEMLALLTCDPSLAEYKDIQYTPIISVQEKYMFSPAVLSGSNLVRNLLCHKNKRLTLRNKIDPMQDSLANALKNIGFLVETEVNRKINKKELEIDILAYRDNYLFIFECKNAYHPCNVYELRNSYQHITHAAEQLEKRKSWLLDISKQQTLFKSLGWEINPTGQVITCIAIGNRVFNGYECAGHPVRQVHELLNVLKNGVVIINDEKRRIWNGLSFSVNDLVEYIAGETSIADFLANIHPHNRQFKFGSKTLIFTLYSLNLPSLSETGKARYPIVEPAIFNASE